eukprot:m.231547 g.231547  ORF g.231547 m.231547 type:complete len:59 (-) comp15218_c0_seq20:2846-3022(-)
MHRRFKPRFQTRSLTYFLLSVVEQPIDTQSDVWRCFDQAFSTYSMKHLVLTSFVTGIC